MRARTIGATATRAPAGASSQAPSSASSARGMRVASSAEMVQSGSPFRTASPGLTWRSMPAACTTGSLARARPAPSRHAATPNGSASWRASTPSASATTVCVSFGVGSAASGSPPCATTKRRHTSIARPSCSAASTSASPLPTASSISRASATVSSTTSDGPPPASTSTDSRTSLALPIARPSGTSIVVSSARVSTPASRPSDTIVSASSLARSNSCMNAPEPNFTSSTSAPVPSAIFFDMIDDAMSGIASTVPVMSRSA